MEQQHHHLIWVHLSTASRKHEKSIKMTSLKSD